MSTRIGSGYVVHDELMTVGGQMTPDTAMAEMIRQQLQTIGIDGDVKEAERGLASTKTANTEHQTMFWTVGGSENLYPFPRYVLPLDPVECRIGMPFARWYASNAAQGKKPTNPEMLHAFEPFRSAAGKREAERTKIAQRAGDLEDHRRGVLHDRHRRPVACAPGRALLLGYAGAFNRHRKRTRDRS